MTLGRSAASTHSGRKRRHNEDAFVVAPPLFVIADGMGGAQAGEVASALAASAVREIDPATGDAEARVTALIQEANRRVHQRASEDPAASGMGTTMTVALVEEGKVTIGHVGDSRAYLVRNGELTQVTEDHSLVQELIRSGRLSREEAGSHPQRSVITRALGTEADVDVDTFSVETKAGDLFLLCSDGLNTMVDDAQILALVERHRADLDRAAKALVRAANRSGGEDNITVVCFEIAEAGGAAPAVPAPAPPAEEAEAEEDTLSGLQAVSPVRTVEPVAWEAEKWEPAERPPRGRRRGRRRLAFAGLGTIVLLAIAAALGVWGLSRSHFVGAEKDGHLAVYQGVPYDLFGGAKLYRSTYVSEHVVASQLTQKERRKLFDHDLLSEQHALSKIRRFEQELTP